MLTSVLPFLAVACSRAKEVVHVCRRFFPRLRLDREIDGGREEDVAMRVSHKITLLTLVEVWSARLGRSYVPWSSRSALMCAVPYKFLNNVFRCAQKGSSSMTWGRSTLGFMKYQVAHAFRCKRQTMNNRFFPPNPQTLSVHKSRVLFWSSRRQPQAPELYRIV